MSDFVNREAARIKQAMDARRVKDEKEVQQTKKKETDGLHLWEVTRDAARKIVDELNERFGDTLLLWRSADIVEINVIAPKVSQSHNLLAKFEPSSFRVTWRVPAAGSGGRREMVLVVVDSELMWSVDATNYTAQQAAEKLIRELTSTIT